MSVPGTRTGDEIRADLRLAGAPLHRTSGDFLGPAATGYAINRLLADVPSLLVRAEAAEAEVEAMQGKLSDVFCEITGGRLSYPTYEAQTIISEVNDRIEDYIREAVAEVESERDEARAELAALRRVVQAVRDLADEAVPFAEANGMHPRVYVDDLRAALAVPADEPATCPVTLKPCDCTGRGGCCRLHHTDGRKCAPDCIGPVAASPTEPPTPPKGE